jgi:hypothetical protein
VESLARMADGRVDQIYDLARPFSNFNFLSNHQLFKNIKYSLPRIFCESRRAKSSTLVVETLDESEETLDETIALRKVGLIESKLWRLTFWTCSHDKSIAFSPADNSLVGYAIVRADILNNRADPVVHVFESVFQKYDHFHNFVPDSPVFNISFGAKRYSLPGVMYCQQNAITKACAQVSLRSLLATRFPKRSIKYSEINDAAKVKRNPGKGLNTDQIRSVLDYFKVNYRDVNYDDVSNPATGSTASYDKLLYVGIENGGGGLLGFKLSGKNTEGSSFDYGRHIIPFFGHTFNQDTWAPRSQNSYFHINEETRYIPSDEWLSSFIGHDDNFGSNYCIPKGFLKSEQVRYAVALLPDGYMSYPTEIEAIAADQLYSLILTVPPQYYKSFWLEKLICYIERQDVVFRTRAISGEGYIKHLEDMRDWENHRMKDQALLSFLSGFIPKCLWMVELSIPEVFSTNYGKLGEILFFGDQELDMGADYTDDQLQQMQVNNIISVRLPGVMSIRIRNDRMNGKFIPRSCGITGHVPLFGCPAY